MSTTHQARHMNLQVGAGESGKAGQGAGHSVRARQGIPIHLPSRSSNSESTGPRSMHGEQVHEE